MNCPNCLMALPQGAIFCTRCGLSQTTNPQAATQVTKMPSSPLATRSEEKAAHVQPQQALSTPTGKVPTPVHLERATGILLAEHEEHKEQEHKEHEKEGGQEENERLTVFSDGIIAFALTVAAITIKIPPTEEGLVANSFSIVLRSVMYIIAFIIVASAWNDHHTIFHYIKRNNVVLVALNFCYLAAIVMFPIGLFFLEFGIELSDISATVSEDQITLGIGIFLGSQIIAGLVLFGMWLYAKKHSNLFEADLEPRFASYMTLRLISKPVTFVVMLVAAYFSLFVPYIALPILAVILIARSIFFRRYRRGLDLSVGTNDTKRIQLFSDAVIGIAITLSVAQIEFPSLGEDGKNALEAVDHQWPLLHAFLVGIVIMGIYWLFHYHLFRLIKRHDGWLIFLNSSFLLAMALMIIPVNWFVSYYNQGTHNAYHLFSLWQIITTLVLAVMWWHVSHKKRLLAPEASPEVIRQFSTMVIANPVIFLALTIFGGFIPDIELPSIYIGVYLALIGAVWLFSRWLTKHRIVS